MPIKWGFRSGHVASLELGVSIATKIGDGPYIWAEGSDRVGYVRCGYLADASDWAYVPVDVYGGDWRRVLGTPYSMRVSGDDPVNQIWIKEADNE